VKIALVKLSAMGDIIHAMVALQFIKKHLPDAQIDWIVEESFVEILQHNPHIDNILPVSIKRLKRDKLKIFSEIQKVKNYSKNSYDIVIDAQGLLKSALLSWLLGYSVGFNRASIREKIATLFYKKTFFIPYQENVIYRNMELIGSALGISFDRNLLKTKESFLYFEEADRAKTAPFLSMDKKNIVYIMGSSWESKIYPREHFVTLIDALEGNHLLVWGNKSELASAQFVAMQTTAEILPQMSLCELKALIASADLVIGADSGPTHCAWAMNRPSITLFGPTPSERNTLETEINRVLKSASKVDALHLNREDFSIREITPMSVATLAKELLNA